MTLDLLSSNSAKALGAFYTPTTIADMLAEWVIRSPGETILEPSAGDGALIRAALDAVARKFGHAATLNIVACDINPLATASIQGWLSGNHDVRTCDFLSLDSHSVGHAGAVIANPPFTRNHALPPAYRNALRSRFGIEGAAGLWVHFLAHASTFLVPGGRLAAVIPAAATFTRYGQHAIDRLRESFASVELRTFVDKPVWVNGAEERGAVVLADGYRAGSCEEVTISRWSTFGLPQAEIHAGNPACFHDVIAASVSLGAIASLSIGAVTGCNRVFLLNEVERYDADIQLDEVLTVVSRARQVPGLFVTREDLKSLAIQGEKTWMLAPPDLDRRRAGVRSRLAAIDRSTRKRTIWLNKRSPWWRIDHVDDCDAVFTYMNDRGPRLVLAGQGITCTNTLHRVSFAPEIDEERRVGTALTMISTFGQLAAERKGRTYGGGVLKFELSDARGLPTLLAPAGLDHAELVRADKALKSGQVDLAREIADRLLLPNVLGRSWQSAVLEMGAELSMLRAERIGR